MILLHPLQGTLNIGKSLFLFGHLGFEKSEGRRKP